MEATCSPTRMKSMTLVALPRTVGLPASPRQIPFTMVDFPDPFGPDKLRKLDIDNEIDQIIYNLPIMTLRFGPQ